MQCEHVQDLILTDYIDGQLMPEQSKAVEAHVAVCGKCQELLAAVRVVSEKSFLEPKSDPVSQKHVWKNIKEAIENESTLSARNPITGPADWLRSLFPKPQPAFALAAFIIALFIVVIKPQFNAGEEIVVIESGDYFDDEPLVSQTVLEGYETAIEEYFL